MSDTPFQRSDYLIVPLLRGFEWFDESLQRSLVASGQPTLTRPESMVMMHVQMGIVRPADIARSLRITRQAVHSTINSLIERDIFALEDDPADGRVKQVVLTARGNAMRADAKQIVDQLTDELTRRVGKRAVQALRDAFVADWGTPITIKLRGD
ncbi:MarR family winged helix-turn-helix transcriptional regulator [Sphingoaurantiacus capsulatus]|uniref:MarR family winged helix-turn-helix transcriptional regulator n=1 Tax=Sphingoaurantiacus capsulatus TaxID=1771310 RepID=A0ABV7XB17_9SPHN